DTILLPDIIGPPWPCIDVLPSRSFMGTTLEIPSTLYGQYADVRRHVNKAMKAFLAGKSSFWQAIAGDGAMVSVASQPGLVLLDGPHAQLGNEAHFQIYVPLAVFSQEMGKLGEFRSARGDAVALDSLTAPWRFVGAVAPPNSFVALAAERQRPFL